ncbi:DNA-directed RNA polymerase subunit D [Candidatus Woesearchaeota archaeon]|nr:MAG: DNA-directed RNA polymerase subunit D [Candidatus Woesearchaeota archaeon]
MEMKKLSMDDMKGSFLVKGTTAWYLNTLRRLIINNVPTLAIEDVTFIENSSALYDEIIAHRLGLVPLVTDETYVDQEKCKCKGAGCAHCTLQFTLNKIGPCTVYAEDLVSKDPKVKAVYPKMPIVKLLEGQSLKIEAVAVMSHGKDHIKHTPGLFYYQQYPTFKIKEHKNAKKCVDVCPKKILELKGNKLKVVDETKCNLCMACVDECPEAIEVKGSETDFIVNVESWGQLTVKQILTEAVRVFDDELDDLAQEVNKIK